MTEEKFPNSSSRPDAVLDDDYVAGVSTYLTLDACPPGALVTGAPFRCKVGTTLYHITDLGAGNILWAFDSDHEDTSDIDHVVGTPLFLEFTSGSVAALKADALAAAIAVDPLPSDADPAPTAGTADPGVNPDFSRSDHVHVGAAQFRDLLDVTFGTPTDGQIPAYDAGSDKLLMVDPPSGGGAGDFVLYAGGDITVPTGGFAELDSALRITLNAAAGDLIEVGLNGLCTPGVAGVYAFDIATIVSGAIQNRFAAGSDGAAGWLSDVTVSTKHELTGSLWYTVQSADMVSGQVTVSLAGNRVSGAAAGTVSATATDPLLIYARVGPGGGGGGGFAAPTFVDATGDTDLTPANTMVDVAGLTTPALGVGTWLVKATLAWNQAASGSGSNFAAKLYDGGSTIYRTASTVGGGSWVGQMILEAEVVVSSGTTTVKVAARAQTNHDTITRYDQVIGGTTIATWLSYQQVA